MKKFGSDGHRQEHPQGDESSHESASSLDAAKQTFGTRWAGRFLPDLRAYRGLAQVLFCCVRPLFGRKVWHKFSFVVFGPFSAVTTGE